MTTHTGQCLCGQAGYTAEGAPMFVAACHCRNCQRQSGSAYSVVAGYPSTAVALRGTLTTYDDTGDSGKTVHRRFCSTCGAPLLSMLADQPDLTLIKVGTLDDASAFKPQVQVWCDSAQPWAALDPAVPQLPRNPG